MPDIGWGLITIVGVIALLVVYLFVIKKNKDSDIPLAKTEKATHDLYEEADHTRDGRPE